MLDQLLMMLPCIYSRVCVPSLTWLTKLIACRSTQRWIRC